MGFYSSSPGMESQYIAGVLAGVDLIRDGACALYCSCNPRLALLT